MHAYTASCSPKPCTALTTLGLGCRDACLSSLSGSALWGLRLRLRAPETPLEPLGIGPRHAFDFDFGVRTVSDAQQSPRPGHTHHPHSQLGICVLLRRRVLTLLYIRLFTLFTRSPRPLCPPCPFLVAHQFRSPHVTPSPICIWLEA